MYFQKDIICCRHTGFMATCKAIFPLPVWFFNSLLLKFRKNNQIKFKRNKYNLRKVIDGKGWLLYYKVMAPDDQSNDAC